MCFGEATNPVAVATARLTVDGLAPGKQASVSVPLHHALPDLPGRRPRHLTFRAWRWSSGSSWWGW